MKDSLAQKMNAPWITGEHSKLLIHMVMRAFLLDVAIYTPITKDFLLPLDGVGSAVPSLQLHPVFGIDTERVPPNDAMSRFVGFGDKSWDNLKNFFQTQGFEFLFLSQSARRVAFGGSMAPKTPVLKLNRPFARKPPAAIASELTRVACAPFAKPQVAGLRHS
ncbi:hypothetical protein [Senegalimassilia anaerobia]